MACVHTVSRNISYTDSGECEYTAKKYFNNAHIGGLKKYIFLPQQIICPLPRQISLADDGNECANKLILTIV